MPVGMPGLASSLGLRKGERGHESSPGTAMDDGLVDLYARADSIGSHLLGSQQGAEVEVWVQRWFFVLVLAIAVSNGGLIVASMCEIATLLDVMFFVNGFFTVGLAAPLWLTVRMSILRDLLRRPGTWFFLCAQLVSASIRIWNDVARGGSGWTCVGSTFNALATGLLVTLLPLADGLPRYLCRLGGRVACPVIAVFYLYYYVQVRYIAVCPLPCACNTCIETTNLPARPPVRLHACPSAHPHTPLCRTN